MGTIEAFRMALSAVLAHKLRSFLTLVGIIAGVASIIAVMTGISVVQVTIWFFLALKKRATPFSAMLFDSVAPEVKMISSGEAPKTSLWLGLA